MCEKLDNLRKDIKWQINACDDLDWDYLLYTCMEAKILADNLGINMCDGGDKAILDIYSDIIKK